MTSDLPPIDRCCVEPTEAQLAVVGELGADRPVVMLNLLRFRDVADYEDHPDLAPDSPISGAEAYQRYGQAAQVHLGEVGASVEYFASCGPTVIGPEGERWDMVLLVRYPDPGAFLAMVAKPEYQALAGHRAAALVDSRLVPTFG
jgi:uncharacterized protein (DUF1330 family)